MTELITKMEFLSEVSAYEEAMKKRWEFLVLAINKSLRVRPYKKGSYMKGLVRSAIVTVPDGLTHLLCKEDLAMLVAGGPHYGSFRVMKKSESNIIDTKAEVGKTEFIVTVAMNIGMDSLTEEKKV